MYAIRSYYAIANAIFDQFRMEQVVFGVDREPLAAVGGIYFVAVH